MRAVVYSAFVLLASLGLLLPLLPFRPEKPLLVGSLLALAGFVGAYFTYEERAS